MNDNGVRRRSLFDFEYALHSGGIRNIRAQPVDRFRGESHCAPCLEQSYSDGDLAMNIRRYHDVSDNTLPRSAIVKNETLACTDHSRGQQRMVGNF